MNTTTNPVSVEQRMTEAHQGVIGVMSGLMAVRQKFGDQGINIFLDSVEERGEALWIKFRTARDKGEVEGFVQFAAKIITPKLLGQ